MLNTLRPLSIVATSVLPEVYSIPMFMIIEVLSDIFVAISPAHNTPSAKFPSSPASSILFLACPYKLT